MKASIISRYQRVIARLQRLTQPYDSVQGLEERRLSQWLATLMLALIFVILFVQIPRYILSGSPSLLLRTGIGLFCAACLFVAYHMCRRGRYQIASYSVIFFGSAVIIAAAPSIEGEIGLRSLYYLMILTVFGNLFFVPKVMLLAFAFQQAGMLLVPALTSTITFHDIIEGPMAFNVIVTVTSLIFAQYRMRLEADRRHQVEASEANYRELLENVSDIVYSHTFRGEITAVNPAIEVTGWKPQELIGQPVSKMIHPDDIERTMTVFHAFLSGKTTPTIIQMRMLSKDDSATWIELKVTPRFENGRLVSVSGIGRDMTQRMQSELALRESEERHRVLVDLSADAIFIEDMEGNIWDCNEAACRITGYTKEELLRLNVRELVADEPDKLIGEIIAEEAALDFRLIERANRRKDGTVFPVEVSTRRIIVGGAQRLAVYVRDISERKLAESQMLKVTVEQERLNLVTRLIQAVSHDFRTSLAQIETSRYLIGRKVTGEERENIQPQLDATNEAVRRLTEQMVNLNTIFNLKEKQTAPQNLNALLELLLKDTQLKAEAKNISIHFDPNPNLPISSADAEQIRLALRQLLLNAISYTPDGGTVTVKTDFDDQHVTVAVRDTGIGIEPEHHHYIFDMFYRVDSARSQDSGGVGVGLTIARMIAQVHGGQIVLDSVPGEGSTFTLMLPYTPVGEVEAV